MKLARIKIMRQPTDKSIANQPAQRVKVCEAGGALFVSQDKKPRTPASAFAYSLSSDPHRAKIRRRLTNAQNYAIGRSAIVEANLHREAVHILHLLISIFILILTATLILSCKSQLPHRPLVSCWPPWGALR